MRNTFACGHCRHVNRFTLYSINYWRANDRAAMQRCEACGASHGCRNFEAEVIPPLMQPIDGALRLSPWMPPQYRPVVMGWYECEFRDADGAFLLFWDGIKFIVNPNDARKVNMRTLYRWRGSWA